MNWSAIFAATNVVALICWAMLLFLPRGPKVSAVVLYGGVGLLCLSYGAMMIALALPLLDPGRVAGAPGGNVLDYSIAGLRNLFLSDAGLVLGWTHYLAFDLFVGLWIAKDADHKGFARWFQLPFLLLTFVAGPIGLCAWLITREARARRVARAA